MKFGEWIVPKPYKLILERTAQGGATVTCVEPNPTDMEYIERSTRHLLNKMDRFDAEDSTRS
jgi:hypothetical protein